MKSASRLWYVLWLVLPSACTHTASNPSGVFVTVRPQVVAPDSRGEAMPVPPGQALRPGQVFALDLVLEQPAHVYVIHRRGGLLGGLYPGVGLADAELSAGTVRVPGPDTFMQVPELDRQSRLCVLLSAQPLEPQLRRCPDGRAGRYHPPGRGIVQSFMLPSTH